MNDELKQIIENLDNKTLDQVLEKIEERNAPMTIRAEAVYAFDQVLRILEEHNDDKDRIEAIQTLRSAWLEAMILNEEKELLNELHTD